MNYQPTQIDPSFTLVGQGGTFAGRSFTGRGESVLIGREQGCAIQLEGSNVSRHHARINFIAGTWTIEDLGSANGTTVNGQRITSPRALRPGDTIGFGTATFSFQAFGGAVGISPATVVEPQGYQQPAYQQAPQPYPQQPPQQAYPPPGQPVYPPPQQPAYPPPAYYPPPPPPRRKSGCGACVWIGLVGVILLCAGSIVAAALLSPVPLRMLFQNPVAFVQQLFGVGDGVTNVGSELVAVMSSQSGVVSLPNGANIVIPQGAVPPMEDGTEGTMNFSMRINEDLTPTLGSDFTPVGPVYELGPEGFTFRAPVQLTLPIPDGTDPANVGGLTFYDAAEGAWKLVPGAVDPDSRSVTVMTTHFSPWGMFSVRDNWREQNGGWFRITNNHTYNTGTYPGPGGRGLPMGITYGICIQAYNLDNPALGGSWVKPRDWQITVSDYRSSFAPSYNQNRSLDWWAPAGTYELIEVLHISEVNQMVGYIPAYGSWFRTLGTYRIENGKYLDFAYSYTNDFSNFTQGRPDCFGVEDTSVGTGDVQVTLTWNQPIDLDLYVTEPGGETIFYNYTLSSTGGQLDRDNLCSEMIVGRPENIFWPAGGAPSGEYKVYVDYFSGCDTGGSVSYTVRTVVRGQVQTYTGTISSGQQEVTTFTLP